ncbi:MAG: hypothetical protein AAGG51_01940 [Cyanobacteria bacterium P01_G01_bin.54]
MPTLILRGDVVPLTAVVVPTENPKPLPLQLYGRVDSIDQVTLLDFTGMTGKARSYRGRATNDDTNATQSAFRDAVKKYAADSELPPGIVIVRPLSEFGFLLEAEPIVAPSNGSISWRSFFATISVGSGVGALGLAGLSTVFPPAAAGIPVLMMISSSAAAASAGLSLLDRFRHGTLEWDQQTQWDLLDLITSLAFGANTAYRLTGRIASSAPVGSRAVLLAENAGRWADKAYRLEQAGDIATGFLIAKGVYDEIEAIQNNPNISDQEKRILIERAIGHAALSGTLITISLTSGGGRTNSNVVNAAAASGPLGAPDLNRVTAITSQMADQQLAAEINNSQLLQNALHYQGYNPLELERAWQLWNQNKGSGRLVSRTFEEYAYNSKDLTTTLGGTVRIVDVVGPGGWNNFINLPNNRSRSFVLLSRYEQGLVNAFQANQLPPNVQQSMATVLDQDHFRVGQDATTGQLSRVPNQNEAIRNAQERLMYPLNQAIGESISTVAEYEQMMQLTHLAGNRGSIAEHFAARHKSGGNLGSPQFRHPRFTAAEVPGITTGTRVPDRIRSRAQHILEYKEGRSPLNPSQFRDFVRIVEESQNPVNTTLRTRLQNDYDLPNGELLGISYLFMPRTPSNMQPTMASLDRVYKFIQDNVPPDTVQIELYFMDSTGNIQKYLSPGQFRQIGSQLPE